MKLKTLLLSSALILAGGVANAQTTWDMSGGTAPPGTTLGTTQTFSAITGDIGLQITASGFSALSMSGTVNLFEKNGGADEIGLGLVNDPSGDHEITIGSAILVNFTNGVNAGATLFDWRMNSTTAGEKWLVLGSNSLNPASFTNVVGQGTDELDHTVLGIPFDYYLFTSLNGNVLLSEISGAGGNLTPVAGVPEPSTWAMMLLGFIGLGFAFRQRRRIQGFA